LREMKNYVDTAFTLPQYLVLRKLPVQQVGWLLVFGSPKSTRENRSRRNLHGNEEESKKEETLTVCETILRKGRDFNQPLRRSTS
jgi:hypothetical protein